VGRWRSQGHIVGDAPVQITGTDIYQWLHGGFFLVHHVDVVIGDQQVQAIELLGEYDPAADAFTARAYDNQGNVTVMRARVDEQGVWRFTGGGDVAPVARPASARASGAEPIPTRQHRRNGHDHRGQRSPGDWGQSRHRAGADRRPLSVPDPKLDRSGPPKNHK
jgi:hypothetical protein